MPAKTTFDAIRVNQWLPEWDSVVYSGKSHRKEPGKFFYVAAVPAALLRRLSGIYRRTADEPVSRAEDLGIQRRLDESRTREIAEYVTWGYPLSDVPDSRRQEQEFRSLRKPGWLATAIVVNVLRANEVRGDARLASADALTVGSTPSGARFEVPRAALDEGWNPKVRPIEVIDGQHRLFSFDERSERDFDLPVVLFHGLDISWQAYLFWVINIKPKRITPSLAYDLYPLLRTEDWLEKFAGHQVYRESRAQELTEALWAHPESPWFKRINMLGEAGFGQAPTQAAWVRALMATFVKSWEGRRTGIGGLFGAPIGSHQTVLPWDRGQQAAFLVQCWADFRGSIEDSNAGWSIQLRARATPRDVGDAAFYGTYSLIPTDQGIRGILGVFNDLIWTRAEDLQLDKWQVPVGVDGASINDQERISESLKSLRRQRHIREYIAEIAAGLQRYDWRSSAFPDLEEDLLREKQALRGSGGYKVLRGQLLQAISRKHSDAGSVARRLLAGK